MIVADLAGWEDRYTITSSGAIYSKARNMYLTSTPNYGRYLAVTLYDGKKTHRKYVHRLLAETFLPNPGALPCVNHKDGNKYNNILDNLEWTTWSGNTSHAVSLGLIRGRPGERHPNARLTDKEIISIREEAKTLTQKELADKYKVSKAHMSRIINNKRRV